MTVTILTGDARDMLATLPAASIDLTVTSPPYDNLRKYGGYSFDFEAIAAELFRVTKDGGVVVWVVGDATVKGSETGTSFRQALHFKDIGFNLHDTMIYQKAGTGACGSNLAYWQSFEFMFVLSKGRPRTTNLLEDVPNGDAGTTRTAGRRNADGVTKLRLRPPAKDFSRRANVWRYVQWLDTKRHPALRDHPARFPEQLAADHILSWSNPGDTVLDPFLGSGTTAKMADRLGRHCIGIELNPAYVALARERLGLAALPQLEAAD